MGMVWISGLTFNGHQLGYEDAGVVVPPTTPPVVANSVLATSVALGSDDNYYIHRMLYLYSQVLKSLPGGHSLFFDILTNKDGKRYSDTINGIQPPGTVKDPVLKNWIDQLTNYASYNIPLSWDVKNYQGRLIAVYDQLVKDKLARVI
jgi:hypothetical protein